MRRKHVALVICAFITSFSFADAAQAVEVRRGGDTDPLEQYVWDIRYIDAPVLRWRDDNDDSDFADAGETLYYSNDANMNVTVLVSASSGSVVERYVYSPYGSVTIYDDDWSDTVTWANSKKNEILFCGYRWDPESALYHVRHRNYNPALGRWLTRDVAYQDSLNRYEYALSSPSQYLDYLAGSAQATAVPPTQHTMEVVEQGTKYTGTGQQLEKGGVWQQIGEGTLGECPKQLTIPQNVEDRIRDALTKTLAEKVEYGGLITMQGAEIVAWDPYPGSKTDVDVQKSAPPSRRASGEWLGSYHTHPDENSIVQGQPPPLETRFSPADFQNWWRHEQVTILRNCRCTYALLRTKSTDDASQENLERFSQSIDVYTNSSGMIDEALKAPTLTAKWNKWNDLVRSKYEQLAKSAASVGVCVYRKCGSGPNVDQQKLDLVSGK